MSYLQSLTQNEIIEYIPIPLPPIAPGYAETRKSLWRISAYKEPVYTGSTGVNFACNYIQPTDVLITLDASLEYMNLLQIFDAIQALYQSRNNTPRDRQIADRLTSLFRDAIAEDESIRVDSIKQFVNFFLIHNELGFPKITLTPDGTIRARWIRGDGDFTAIEFTGQVMVRLVAEIPRERGLTARYFGSEPLSSVVSVAGAVGASFASHA